MEINYIHCILGTFYKTESESQYARNDFPQSQKVFAVKILYTHIQCRFIMYGCDWQILTEEVLLHQVFGAEDWGGKKRKRKS